MSNDLLNTKRIYVIFTIYTFL